MSTNIYQTPPWRIVNDTLIAGPRAVHLFKLSECPGLGDQAACVRALIESAPDLLLTAQAMLDWMREHTSPGDDNSPHNIMIAATVVIDKATKAGRS